MARSTLKLNNFFITKQWISREDENFFVLTPPRDLGFSNTFELLLNKEINEKYFENKMGEYFQIISDIYGISTADLTTLILDEKEIFSMRIIDEETRQGEINLSRFEYLLQKIKDILLKTADFVLEDKVQGSDYLNNARANQFLNACIFLQTQKGSFISRIALPVENIIKPADLFDGEIKAKEVNKRFFSMLDFSNRYFFADTEQEISQNFIKENRENINVDILRDINSLYKNGIRNVEFAYLTENYDKKETKPQLVAQKKIEKFANFVNSIEKSTIRNTLNSICYVIGVKDKQLEDGKKHCMTLISTQFGNKIEIQLDDVSDDIHNEAIDALKINKAIKVIGDVEELKSYLRITNLKKFDNIVVNA